MEVCVGYTFKSWYVKVQTSRLANGCQLQDAVR